MTEFLEAAIGRTTAIEGNTCTFCRKEAVEFEDDLSRKEYTISGLCQSCQNEVFKEAR
jgi:hypothetical protein